MSDESPSHPTAGPEQAAAGQEPRGAGGTRRRRGLASKIEQHSIEWIPDSERHGKVWYQPILWFLGNFQFSTIALGFVGPLLGLSLLWTFVSAALGILIGTFFMAFHASQGPKLGLPQMIQSRAQFGYRGVIVPMVAVLVTYVSENIINQVLISSGVAGSFGVNATVAAIIAAILAVVLAVFGHDWVHRAFQALLAVTLPLMLAISAGIVFGFAGGGATHVTAHYGFSAVGFMAELATAIAYNITYAVYVSDYSRYLPRRTPNAAIIGSVFGGAALSPIWLIPMGAWMAIHAGNSTDALLGLKVAGNNVIPFIGSITAWLSVLALVAVNAMNAYGASICLLTSVDSFRAIKPGRMARVAALVLVGVAWYVIGANVSGGAVNTLFTIFTLLLYLLIPWTATNLVDFFLVRKGKYSILDIFRPAGIYRVWNWRGLVAYACGIAAEIPFMVLPAPIGYTGVAARQISSTDISWVVGLSVASLVYWIVTRSLDLTAELPAVAASEAKLASGARVL
ncbi:MAG: purine-cytosine permease family protein, partial [Streptosporangiaceae bacterium]